MREHAPVTEDFLSSAPVRATCTQTLPCTPEQLFESLSGVDDWAEWVDLGVTWTSPRPFGVGTTRRIKMFFVEADEHFFIWEEGRRFTFYLERSNVPGVTRLAEDYQVTPSPGGGCTLSWTMALEGRSGAGLLYPLTRTVLPRVMRRNLGRLERLMQRRCASP
ncbi:MAG: SRPBCC family protein [Alphaproteobacteria bacterium]|nr:SRPBCC family protein [Alphaproteobacteria bacterium]MCB9795359.1 SRPBCC family protein [Alphaproteobacteria bacterium]